MNRAITPTLRVGNEFLISKPEKQNMKVEVKAPEASLPPQPLMVAAGTAEHAVEAPVTPGPSDEPDQNQNPHQFHLGDFITNLIKQHPIITVSIILLLIGSATIILGGRYWASRNIVNHASATTTIKTGKRPITGLNLTVPADQYEARLQAITKQPATLTVGPYTTQVGSDTIRGWLQITANKNKSEYYIHLNKAAIANSLVQRANKYAKNPVNQVTVTEDGVDRIVVGGRNGTALSDPNSLNIQAQEVAKTVMDGKGLQFNTPLTTVPFQAVTPANFSKLLVSDINRKKMWAFQNGQLVKTIPVSAGAPATPTPVGQFKVYAKFSVQDMRGNNADGSRYFQPKVPWVSYFTAGNAVHGVYWRPHSWFGNVNSSHGCLGTKVDEAKWVYDWAPIGTTVITHL